MYLIESSSPFEPGARPSNSSEASILIWASNPSAVMASSAGFSRSVSESAANPISTNDRAIRMAMIFIYFFCSGGLRPSQLGGTGGQRPPLQLSAEFQVEYFSSVWPCLPCGNKTSTRRIVAHVVPFLFVGLSTAQNMVEKSLLPKWRIEMPISEPC